MSEANKLEKLLDKQVSLHGIAGNAKAGAVLTTDRDEVVYLRGLREWPDEFLDQRVVVTGTLRRGQTFPQAKTKGGITRQGMSGEQWYLEVADYRLAD